MTDVHTNLKSDDLNSIPFEDISLDMECQRQIGNEKYIFFYPKNIGNFVVSCWNCQRSKSVSFTSNSNEYVQFVDYYQNKT